MKRSLSLVKNSIRFAAILATLTISACSEGNNPSGMAAEPPHPAVQMNSPAIRQPEPAVDTPAVSPRPQQAETPATWGASPVPVPAVAAPEPIEIGLEECGTAQFGKDERTTHLPLRCIRATYGFDGPEGSQAVAPGQPIQVDTYVIPSAFRSSLAAYWMNLGVNGRGVLLLAPKDWSLFAAGVGANGSHNIRLVNPDDEEQYVDYFDQGGCQGCLVPNIGGYFPELKEWVEEQGYEVSPRPEIAERAMLTPNLVAFRKQSEKRGYSVHGVAYQEHGGGGARFRDEEVGLPSADKAMATAILNLFVALHREQPE
ncbi:DUF4850 domain-containing protein [Paenibacillus ginsengarvi]|nr:DUF4850 domain-containing protein [Paenibacillus ginsengarvi]